MFVHFNPTCAFQVNFTTIMSTFEAYYFKRALNCTFLLFFSVFCDYRSQYWSYDRIVYIFFLLQNISQLLLGTDFLFDV